MTSSRIIQNLLSEVLGHLLEQELLSLVSGINKPIIVTWSFLKPVQGEALSSRTVQALKGMDIILVFTASGHPAPKFTFFFFLKTNNGDILLE